MGRILQRCDVCKRFHVVYIVDDPLYPGGKAHYCHHCWKNKFGQPTPPKPVSDEPKEKTQLPTQPDQKNARN